MVPRFNLALCAFAALSSVALSSASAVTIVASDNAFGLKSQASTNQSEAETLSVKSKGTDSNSRFAFLRFDTSGLSGTLVEASLDLHLVSAGGSLTLEVFGLLDGVAGETTWNSGLTWNTHPGGIVSLPSAGNTTPTNLGSFAYTTAMNNTVISVPLNLSAFSAFLAADTNNQITLILGNNSNSPVSSFASLSNTGNRLVPTLNVAVAVPEPATGLLLLGSSVLLLRKRRTMA